MTGKKDTVSVFVRNNALSINISLTSHPLPPSSLPVELATLNQEKAIESVCTPT